MAGQKEEVGFAAALEVVEEPVMKLPVDWLETVGTLPVKVPDGVTKLPVDCVGTLPVKVPDGVTKLPVNDPVGVMKLPVDEVPVLEEEEESVTELEGLPQETFWAAIEPWTELVPEMKLKYVQTPKREKLTPTHSSRPQQTSRQTVMEIADVWRRRRPAAMVVPVNSVLQLTVKVLPLASVYCWPSN